MVGADQARNSNDDVNALPLVGAWYILHGRIDKNLESLENSKSLHHPCRRAKRANCSGLSSALSKTCLSALVECHI